MTTTFTTDFARCALVSKGLVGAGARMGWNPAKALANAVSWQEWVDAAPGPANRAARAELADSLMAETQTIEWDAAREPALSEAAAWCVATTELPDPA